MNIFSSLHHKLPSIYMIGGSKGHQLTQYTTTFLSHGPPPLKFVLFGLVRQIGLIHAKVISIEFLFLLAAPQFGDSCKPMRAKCYTENKMCD